MAGTKAGARSNGSKKGEGRRGGGRPPGIPNKATMEKALIAQQTVENAKARGIKLGKEVLEEYMLMFSDLAKTYAPALPGAPRVPGRKTDEERFLTYGKLTVECAAKLAPYQSPTFRAVNVTMQADQVGPKSGDAANVIELNDPVAAARVYRNVIQGRR